MFTGDASFRGTSSSGLSLVAVMTATRVVTSPAFSEIPFCNTFGDSAVKGALFVPGVEEAVVLGAAFGVRAGFFIGEMAFPGGLPGDFPSERRDLAAVLPTSGAEGLPPALDDDSGNVPAALEREISLLAESLLCLSVNGDLAVIVFPAFSRGLIAPLEAGGAVFGLDDAPVAGCFDVVTDVLAVVPADVDLGFDVTLDVVDVLAVVDGNDLTDSVVFAVIVLALAGLAAVAVATLPTCFVSPRFIADFFSADVAVLNFDEALLILDLVVVPTRGEILVFVAVVVVVVVAILDDVVVLVPVTLPPALEIAAALIDPSTSCLGRAAADFLARADCAGDDVVVTRAVVVLTALEGDVAVAFVAVFDVVSFVVVVVVFVGRFVAVVVAFALVVPIAVVDDSTVAPAVPVVCFFNSSIFTMSSGDAFAVSRSSLVSSSLFVGTSSDAICFSDISSTFADTPCATSISISFCSGCALLNNVQDDGALC